MREYHCIAIPRMISENDGIECPIPLSKLSIQWPSRPDQTTQITSLLARRPLCAKSGRSRISVKSDPDRFGAVIIRSRSSDAEGGKAWRYHRGFDGSGHGRHPDGSSRISTARKSRQRIIRSVQDRTFLSSQWRRRRPRVTLGKSAAELQAAAIDIAQFMKSTLGILGVGARFAGFCLRLITSPWRRSLKNGKQIVALALAICCHH